MTQTPGDWLRGELERRGLSANDVADAVGLRTQAVYYWLTGRTAPKDEAAAKLAALLGLNEIEVRRRFGLWVPNETDVVIRPDLTVIDREARELELMEKLKELRGALETTEQFEPLDRWVRKAAIRGIEQEITRLEDDLAELRATRRRERDTVVESNESATAN